ncbi:MAG: hypothetical protein ACE5FU_14810 [Nitrospinota bacterium]
MVWWLTVVLCLVLGDLLIVTPALGFYGRDIFHFRSEDDCFFAIYLMGMTKSFIKRYAGYFRNCYNNPWIYIRDFKQQWFLLFGLRGWYVMTRVARMKFSIIGLLILKWRFRFFPESFSEKDQEFFVRAEKMESEFRR